MFRFKREHLPLLLRALKLNQPIYVALLDLPAVVEEGLCQYVAYRYLDHLQRKNEGISCCSMIGFENTLDYIIQHRNFPNL